MPDLNGIVEEVRERRLHIKGVFLDQEVIRDILELPEDTIVERVDYDFMRRGLIITCSRPEWEEVLPGAEPPMVYGHYQAVMREEYDFDAEDGPVVHRHLKIEWDLS